MKRLTTALLLCLIAVTASAMQVALTDVKHVKAVRTAHCIYSGHGTTRTVEFSAKQMYKAAMTFETENN